MNNKLRPNTPNPTTPIPITAPPANATSRAFPRLVLAALVVLTFALVATLIPINPASAEQMAPKINEKAIIGEEPSVLFVIPNKIATTTTKMLNILYSAFKKAMAPSAISSAIRPIRSVPTSCFETQADFQKVYARATSPSAKVMIVIVLLPISVKFGFNLKKVF